MSKFKYTWSIGAAITLSMGSMLAGAPAMAASSTVIPDSAAPGLTSFTDLGQAPTDATMNLTLFLKLRNQNQLDQTISAHKTMTPAAFHANFSPTSSNYNAVENQLSHAGFTIVGTSDNNMAIDIQGTVADVESVLGTDVHQFQDANGNTFLANTTDYHVSGALASQLAGAVGADEFANPRPTLVSAQSVSSSNEPLTLKSAQGTAPHAQFFDGIQSANVQNAYDFNPVYQQGLDGSGQTIAIVDAYGSPTIQSDLQMFNHTVEQGSYGVADPLNLTVMSPPGVNVKAVKNPVKSSNAADWAGEVSMDVELSHAAAPGANLLLVATPNNGSDLYMGVNQVVDKDLANQLSLSFGSPEAYTPASERQAIDQIFAQAAAEGINVFVSSGDWGDFTQPPYSSPVPKVSFPASDPNVISVGGSSLFVNKDSSYNSEIEWGDTFSKIVKPDGTVLSGPIFQYGTGGGTSQIFAKPAWQTGVSGLGATNMRQVPDVGFNSDPFTGFALVINGQVEDGWGGTSDAAPQWAAICALANQGHVNRTGNALPFINPILYAGGHGAFHDVQHGTVAVTFQGRSGTVYNMTMGADTSLQAAPGWDDTTGLGTPDVSKVVGELVNAN